MSEQTGAAGVETAGAPAHRHGLSIAARIFFAAFTLLMAYGVVYYAAMYTLGWRRLYELLGERTYNALIPAGGLPVMILGTVLLLIAMALSALWRRLARLGIARYVAFALLLLVGLPLASALRRHSLGEVGGLVFDHVLALPLDTETEYAPGYSDEAFDSVQLGMPESDVLALLGSPLASWNGREPRVHYARYSKSPRAGSYWERKIIYRNGTVERIDTSLWVD